MSTNTNSCITKGEGCGSATNYPQFIDTQACLCGFVSSREPSRNGNLQQVWHCIGDASQDVAKRNHGKWFYPQLPSEESSGYAQPQNWDDNPPDLKKIYVLVMDNNQNKYQELVGDSAPQLEGNDVNCTGKNSTELSRQYYHNKKSGSSSASSQESASSQSTFTSSTSSPSSTSSASASSTSSASSSSISSATASSSSSAPASSVTTATLVASSSLPAPSSSPSSDAPSLTSKSTLLLGMLLLPAIARLL